MKNKFTNSRLRSYQNTNLVEILLCGMRPLLCFVVCLFLNPCSSMLKNTQETGHVSVSSSFLFILVGENEPTTSGVGQASKIASGGGVQSRYLKMWLFLKYLKGYANKTLFASQKCHFLIYLQKIACFHEFLRLPIPINTLPHRHDSRILDKT